MQYDSLLLGVRLVIKMRYAATYGQLIMALLLTITLSTLSKKMEANGLFSLLHLRL